LGEIGRNGPLALPYDDDENSKNGAVNVSNSAKGASNNDDEDKGAACKTQKGVVDKLMEIAGNAKLPMKVRWYEVMRSSSSPRVKFRLQK
jgi:hypothetical protein